MCMEFRCYEICNYIHSYILPRDVQYSHRNQIIPLGPNESHNDIKNYVQLYTLLNSLLYVMHYYSIAVIVEYVKI